MSHITLNDTDITGNNVASEPTTRIARSSTDNLERQLSSLRRRTILAQLYSILFYGWINLLLFAVPVGIILSYRIPDSIFVFITNFIAIIPLAVLLSYGTEEIAFYCGDVLGGILNASFGNAVELIISILALRKREIVIVQTSLIGSMLSNLLLVLGMAFLAGGLKRVQQNFNLEVSQTACSVLALAVGSLVIPTVYHLASLTGGAGIIVLSRGTAIVQLLVYCLYLIFQLKTHKHIFSVRGVKTPKHDSGKPPAGGLLVSMSQAGICPSCTFVAGQSLPRSNSGLVLMNEERKDLNETKEEKLSLWMAILLLGSMTLLVAFCAECLVGSIDHFVTAAGVPRIFVGLILLPIVGNAAEHATAVSVAYKDKMDLSINVAIGSSTQIALLIIPFMVILGWCMGVNQMTLYFDGFQVMVLFMAVLLVNYSIQDGKSNYLEGGLLIALYVIIAIAAWC